jgi:hypothetical protein
VFATVALTGTACGGVVGLILGTGYLPTLPFAIIEGAVFGTVCGVLIGALCFPMALLTARLTRHG